MLNNENLQLAAGAMNCTSLASDLSSLKDSTFKVGKLSTEERKEKIHRYMKKRNERNFSKKIKVHTLSFSFPSPLFITKLEILLMGGSKLTVCLPKNTSR